MGQNTIDNFWLAKKMQSRLWIKKKLLKKYIFSLLNVKWKISKLKNYFRSTSQICEECQFKLSSSVQLIKVVLPLLMPTFKWNLQAHSVSVAWRSSNLSGDFSWILCASTLKATRISEVERNSFFMLNGMERSSWLHLLSKENVRSF